MQSVSDNTTVINHRSKLCSMLDAFSRANLSQVCSANIISGWWCMRWALLFIIFPDYSIYFITYQYLVSSFYTVLPHHHEAILFRVILHVARVLLNPTSNLWCDVCVHWWGIVVKSCPGLTRTPQSWCICLLWRCGWPPQAVRHWDSGQTQTTRGWTCSC